MADTRIRRRCMTPMSRGGSGSPQPEYSIRRGLGSRPISAATIGEFGRQYSSFSPDECFPSVLGSQGTNSRLGNSPMDRQLHSLARARNRRVQKEYKHHEHDDLADQYNIAAATPLLEVLSHSHAIKTDPFAKVKHAKKDDMRPKSYHGRIPPAHHRTRPQSGLSFTNRHTPSNDVVPAALQNMLKLPKSKNGLVASFRTQTAAASNSGGSSGDFSSMTVVGTSAGVAHQPQISSNATQLAVHERPSSGKPALSAAQAAASKRPQSGTNNPHEINALLRCRPNSAPVPQPAEIYPLRSIVY